MSSIQKTVFVLMFSSGAFWGCDCFNFTAIFVRKVFRPEEKNPGVTLSNMRVLLIYPKLDMKGCQDFAKTRFSISRFLMRVFFKNV